MVLVIFFYVVTPAQFSNIIPANRRVDWSRVGVEGGINRYVHLQLNIQNLKDANPGMTDLQVLQLAIAQANTFKNSNPGKWVLIYFPSGTYTFTGYIQLGIQDSNIIFRGSGSNSTLINFTVGDYNLFGILGSSADTFSPLDASYGFLKGNKFIKTTSPMNDIADGDWIELVESNGSWHGDYDRAWPCDDYNPGGNPQNYVGQIVRVKNISSDKTVLELYDPLRITYEADLNPRIRRIRPVRNIGFENFRIASESSTNVGSANFSFNFAVNCWIWGVESYNASSAHVSIGASSHIEIRGSYFHHAKSYGSGGRGYGVSIGGHSTNCLIEDNIFSHLRHAMILSTGANGNVFGYNHSRDEINDNPWPYYPEADMSLHGHYPFANLFEGNDVIYGVADDYWGLNGPYNTFFRNWIRTQVWLEKADYTNALGNEFSWKHWQGYTERIGGFYKNGDGAIGDCNQNHGSANVLDAFGAFVGSTPPGYPAHYQAMFSYLVWYYSVLNDVSLYRNERPSFLDPSYSWPPMGPPYGYDPSTGVCYVTSQWIPALDRWEISPRTVAASPLQFPLAASISGPSEVWHTCCKGQPASQYSWSVNVSGGIQPYTYAWYKNDSWVGSASSYTEYLSFNGYGGGFYQFTLRVDVRDGHNTLVSATKTVTAYNSSGGGIGPAVEEVGSEPIPADYSLSQNFPNPFNPETEIIFGLPGPSRVRVTILDLLGREVITLTDVFFSAGYHRIRWNGTDSNGRKVGSGIYFYCITAASNNGKPFSKVMKMAMTK